MSERWRIGDLARELGARLHGDATIEVVGVGTLSGAGADRVSFLSNRRYRPQLEHTRAAAVILDEEFLEGCPCPALVMANPYLGYARAASLMNPPPECPPGVSASACVAPGASVHASAHVAPGAVLEDGVRIGARVYVGPGCVIARDAVVGDDSRLSASVTVCAGVVVGRRVILHPGVVLGADGFGIANDDGVWVKVPQLGGVRIGDDVEIGANTTVDRGALEDTVIENGVKLDNLIQVGHNVHIGEHTAVAACVAIGGSARIGRRCTIGGAASLAGHLEIADDVHLTATSAVPNSITEPGVYSSGMPVQDNRSWRKNVIRMRQLDEMARSLKTLRTEVERLAGTPPRSK